MGKHVLVIALMAAVYCSGGFCEVIVVNKPKSTVACEPVIVAAEEVAVCDTASAKKPPKKVKVACRLGVRLDDGSLVYGVPKMKTLDFVTSYASMKIPFDVIGSITIEDDNEHASLTMKNGDKLSVIINLGDLVMGTVFGKVSLPIERIDQITVHNGKLSMDGLVLHYSFDENTGSTIVDKAADLKGTVGGAKWIKQGHSSGAYWFDGVNDYIKLPNEAKQKGPFTVSIWFTQEKPGQKGSLYGGGGCDCAVDRNGIAMTWVPHNKSFYFDVYDTPKRYCVTMTTSEVNIVDGKWHHAVGTYDGKYMALYIDGKLCKSGKKEIGKIKIDWSRADHILGNRGEIDYAYKWYWKGKMDEVMIFNRALSSSEVKELYMRG